MPNLSSLKAEIEQIDDDLKRAYVLERSKVNTDKAGYTNAGFSRGTFYNWSSDERDYLNNLAQRIRTEVALQIMMRFQEVGLEAADVKINGLRVRNERIKQGASTEILEWLIGKPSQSLIAQVNATEAEDDQAEGEKFFLPAGAIAGSFYDVYRDISAHQHTEYVFKGGRGSTKSSFTSEVIIELIVNNPEWHVLATRQVANTLRDSVYSQLVWAINYLGLSDKFKCTTSPLEITYIPTGQKIYFRGGDDPLKIKSIKPRFGAINILFFEELDQFRGDAAVRSIVQSALRGEKGYILKAYNPPRSRNNWVNKYLEIPKPDRYVHESDYRSVPVEWLGQTFIDEAEFLKEINPEAYRHEYLGEVISAGGLVFENVEIRDITDEEISQFDRVVSGLDFGYFPDPAQMCRMHFDAARLTLYVFDEYRGYKHGNRQLYEVLTEIKAIKPDEMVIADSAEPKSIADLRTYGLSIRGAEKGPGSVDYSIKFLQSLKNIVIDNKRAPFTAQEFLNYELETDRDGNYITAYPDRDNHAIDAVRYGTSLIWRRRGS